MNRISIQQFPYANLKCYLSGENGTYKIGGLYEKYCISRGKDFYEHVVYFILDIEAP